MRLFCIVDRAVLHAGPVASRASDLGSHCSPRIGTSHWRRLCASELALKRASERELKPACTDRQPFASAIGQPGRGNHIGSTRSPISADCGTSRSPSPGTMPALIGGQVFRNTYTRRSPKAAAMIAGASLASMWPVRCIELPSVLPSPAEASLGQGGAPFLSLAGRTNGSTIAPRSHRSRHFCCADATLCRQGTTNALFCERPRQRCRERPTTQG
jgi:hypothetical protein